MKILYAAGNFSGSLIRFSRFLENLPDSYDIKLAAFNIPGYRPIDWTLDALNQDIRHDPNKRNHRRLYGDLKLMSDTQMKLFNYENMEIYIRDIRRFAPDLVISDFEVATCYVASLLRLPYIISSPLMLYPAINNKTLNQQSQWRSGKFRYGGLLYDNQTRLSLFPTDYLDLIIETPYSLTNEKISKKRFDLISPYYHNYAGDGIGRIALLKNTNDKNLYRILSKFDFKIFNTENDDYHTALKNSKYVILEGETPSLIDALISHKKVITIPTLKCTEALINIALGNNLGYLYDLGKIGCYSPKKIEDEIVKSLNFSGNNFIINKKRAFLHERIKEYL